MLKTIFLYLFVLVISGACVYFFNEHNYLLAVVLLIIAVSTLFGRRIRRFAEAVDAITKFTELERRCNCELEIDIGMERVLQHKSLAELLERMRSKGTIKDGMSKDEWLARLFENYKQENKNSNGLETVRFNIKNNVLWKNGEIDFRDTIYHEIFIPFEAGAKRPTFAFVPEIDVGITIRVLVVNGILKLQFGNFSKEMSPDADGSSCYRRYETVTSFPLINFSYRHRIPENYLNLSMYATNSYWEKRKSKKGDWLKDWQAVVKDVADYKYVCSVADEYVSNRRRWDKITKRFDQIRDEWLKREGFRDPFASYREDNIPGLHDNSINCDNEYLSVFAANQNESKERWEQYLYPDFSEERG
jgi:hypothetical protein